jgi:hypothetical protein
VIVDQLQWRSKLTVAVVMLTAVHVFITKEAFQRKQLTPGGLNLTGSLYPTEITKGLDTRDMF